MLTKISKCCKGISFNAETNINILDVIEKSYLCVSKIILFNKIFNFEMCYSQHCLQLNSDTDR